MRTLIFLAALLLCLGSPLNLVLAGDFYVSATGDDTLGDGSAGNPWRTITKATTTVVTPGFTINVGPGRYNAGAGEIYPIVLANGVSLQGPQIGVARVESPGTPETLHLAAGAAPRTIAGMYFDNTPGGTAGGFDIIEPLGPTPNLTIADNVFRVARDVMYVDLWGGTTGVGTPSNIQITGNTFIEGDAPNAGSAFWIDYDQSFVHDHLLVFADNDILGVNRGMEVSFEEAGNLELHVENNFFIGCDWSAMSNEYWVDQQTTGVAESMNLSGAIQGNVFTAGDSAIWSSAWGDSLTILDQAIHVIGNEINLNDDEGMNIELSAENSGVVTGPMMVGNIVTNNAWTGISMDVWRDSANTTQAAGIADPWDLGGGARGVLMGRNTIYGNSYNDSSSPVDVWLGGQSSTQTVFAQGNWWGTTNLAAIDARVRDGNDGGGDPILDYSFPLDMTLDAKLSRKKVKISGGTLVKVRAKIGSGYVAFTGDTPIEIRLGGQPVAQYLVNNKGSLVTFLSPTMPATGAVQLVITNPNGTQLVKQMFVIP